MVILELQEILYKIFYVEYIYIYIYILCVCVFISVYTPIAGNN